MESGIYPMSRSSWIFVRCAICSVDLAVAMPNRKRSHGIWENPMGSGNPVVSRLYPVRSGVYPTSWSCWTCSSCVGVDLAGAMPNDKRPHGIFRGILGYSVGYWDIPWGNGNWNISHMSVVMGLCQVCGWKFCGRDAKWDMGART